MVSTQIKPRGINPDLSLYPEIHGFDQWCHWLIGSPGLFWMMTTSWTEPFASYYCPCLRNPQGLENDGNPAALRAGWTAQRWHTWWEQAYAWGKCYRKCCSFLWSPVQCASHQSSANHQSSSMGRMYTPKLEWVGKTMLNYGTLGLRYLIFRFFSQKSNLTSSFCEGM